MIKYLHYNGTRLIFWGLILFALSISGLRMALAEFHFYNQEIAAKLSQQLGARVTIEKIDGILNGFQPQLALHNIHVYAQNNTQSVLQLKQIHIGFDLMTALHQPLLEAIQISLIGANLAIKRQTNGSLTITGLPSAHNEEPRWLLQGTQYQLIDSTILWQDEKRNALPVSLEHVNISIHNHHSQHKIFIHTKLPKSLGNSLSLAMEFTGDMFTPKSVNARLFIQGKNINLAKILTGDLPFDFSIVQGHGDFSLWSTWTATQMTEMSGSIDLHNSIISGKKHPFTAEHITLLFKVKKQQEQWQVALQNSQIHAYKVHLHLPKLAFTLASNTSGDLTKLAINCPYINLGHVSKILSHLQFIPKKTRQQLHKSFFTAQLKDFLLLADIEKKRFTTQGILTQLSFKQTETLPGINNLNIYFSGTEKQGSASVHSEQFSFTSMGLFRETLHFNHTLGKINWQQQAQQWLIHSSLIELDTPDIKTKTKLHLSIPKNTHSPRLSLQTAFFDADVSQAHHYYPAGIMGTELPWLDQAFLSGKSVGQGSVLFRGHLLDYPFIQHQGMFEVLFDVHHVNLHYADNWPVINNLAAKVYFSNESLNINIHQGTAYAAHITQAKVGIQSLSQSKYLTIQGTVKGRLTQAHHFLQQTPFKQKISALNQSLDITGPLNLAIDLKIPLLADTIKTDILATTQGANARIHNLNELNISHINASIHITETGVSSNSLTATLLGFPLTAKIYNQPLKTLVSISGQTDIQHLQAHFPHALWSYFSGESAYQIELDIPKNSRQESQIRFSTELAGMAINFAPFSKTASQHQPLSITVNVNQQGMNAFKLNYENRATNHHRLKINVKKINDDWQGVVQTPFAQGSVFIPTQFNHSTTTLRLHLNQLDLSALTAIKFKNNPQNTLSIKELPTVSLESKHLLWRHTDLGELKLQLTPNGENILIQQCQITSPISELSLTGNWQHEKNKNQTTLQGTLSHQDFGNFLQKTQLSDNLEETSAHFQFSLHWQGSPYTASLDTLIGSIRTHLVDGRLLGIEPGFGRILGALDIWKLSKRLQLDFSDVTAKGLSFTTLDAQLNLNHGLLSTKKLTIDAMPAEITVSGITHLKTKYIDLQATVLPKFPIAGTIMGNIANAVTQTLMGEGHTGGLFLSLLYTIKGTWNTFTIERQFTSGLSQPFKQPIKKPSKTPVSH